MSIDELLDRVDDVLRAMVGAHSQKRFVEHRTGPARTADVSAQVRFRGDNDERSRLVLALDEDMAITLVRQMSGLDIVSGDPIVADGVAELANIVAGVAGLDFSLPTAVYARAHTIDDLADVPLDHGVITSRENEHLDVYLAA